MSATDAIRACLITNPKSGRGGINLTTVLPVLAAHGWQVDVRQKLHGGHATELAREAVDDWYDVVVACGGDGTVGEVVDGVVGSDVAVGVLPGGTANLWAREIGVSMNLKEAALQLVGTQRRPVDVGHLSINGEHGQHFLLMAGLGVDAAVLTRLSKDLKGRFGMLAYLPAIGRALPQTKPFAATMELDTVTRLAEPLQIVVGNTRRYASVTSVTPGALVDDGKLDICVLTPNDPISAARQLSTLVLRKRPDPFSSITDRVGSLVVRTNAIIPLQADGGRVKQKKVKVTEEGVRYEFTVRTQVLTALIPRDYAGTMFQGGTVTEFGGKVMGDARIKKNEEQYRVVSVGIDTIFASRENDGRVISIKLTPDTRAHDASGARTLMSTFLASLNEGKLVMVEREKSKKKKSIVARRIRS